MAMELSKEDIARMQKIHSDFVTQTKADPALAQDLLDATDWNIEAAIEAYKGLSITSSITSQFDDVDTATITGLLEGREKELSPLLETDDQPPTDITKRPKAKRSKAKGLGHVADMVEDMFIRVAVSESKLKAGATNKEKVFDEQFFRHSFLYPDLSLETNEELKKFIQSDIIEKSHKYTLTKAGRLNWWASTGKLPVLEPLATTGDGNCLLHAASLYMWGLPDSYLILRTHLHRVLTTGIEKEGIKRRWRYLTNLRNQEAGGLVFSEEEWEFEWSEIVRIATNQPRRRPTTDSLKRYSTLRTHYESLEEVHVFAMAHVLCRPIIVVADEFVRDMNGDPFAPIYFGGIYLPLECAPSSCYNSPLILAFDSSHFSPLVSKRDPLVSHQKQQANSRLRHLPSRQDTVMPLVTPDGSLLPLPFVYDPVKKNVSERWANETCQLGDFPDELRTLLESYLDIRWIQLKIGSTFENPQSIEDDKEQGFQGKVPKFRFPAAVVSSLGEPEYQSVLVTKYLENVQERFKIETERQEKLAAEKARQEEEFNRIQATRPVPCEGKGCKMFGTAASDRLCSKCYNKRQKQAKKDAKAMSTVDPSSDVVSFPDTWDIVLPDEIAERQFESTDDNGVVLVSQTNDEDNSLFTEDASPYEIPVRSLPASPSTTSSPIKHTHKFSSKTSPKAPPRSPPNTPPKSPPKASPPRSSPKAPPRSPPIMPPKSPPKAPPKSPPKAPPKSPPKAPPKSPPDALPKTPPTTPTKTPPILPSKKSKAVPSRPPPTYSAGYSRDHIKPLSNTDSSRTLCTGGCGFYGSSEFKGMCSQCYKNTRPPSITQV